MLSRDSYQKVYIFCEDDVCEADECFEDLKKAHEEVFRLQKENEGLKKQNEKLSHDNKKWAKEYDKALDRNVKLLRKYAPEELDY